MSGSHSESVAGSTLGRNFLGVTVLFFHVFLLLVLGVPTGTQHAE